MRSVERQPLQRAPSPPEAERDAVRNASRPAAAGPGYLESLGRRGVAERAAALHAMQHGAGNASLARMLALAEEPEEPAVEDELDGDEEEVAAEDVVEAEEGVLARQTLHPAPLGVMRGKGAVAKKVVGWVVTVGERKLIKRAAVYTEKELARLLAKGYNVLVKDGHGVAKRIAKKVWKDPLQHPGHFINKAGKWGLPHFQPLKKVVGKVGEKGWHIFYTAMPVLLYSEDVDAMAIYEDKYPGESKMNYLTVTHYVGEDSRLSYLDWVNPGELLALGGDIGRHWDRERTKELKALLLTRVTDDGTRQTYELDPDGMLQRVIVVSATGAQKELSAAEYYEFLATNTAPPAETPAQDGTESKNYASTFDAEYRIYHSKEGWNYEGPTAAFFLPEADAKELVKVGDFWVNADRGRNYVYAYAHPRHRPALHQPGFVVPKDMASEYFDTEDKTTFLAAMLEANLAGSALFDAVLDKAMTALAGTGSRVPISSGGSGERVPISSGGSGERVPIRSGGSGERVPISSGGGPD